MGESDTETDRQVDRQVERGTARKSNECCFFVWLHLFCTALVALFLLWGCLSLCGVTSPCIVSILYVLIIASFPLCVAPSGARGGRGFVRCIADCLRCVALVCHPAHASSFAGFCFFCRRVALLHPLAYRSFGARADCLGPLVVVCQGHALALSSDSTLTRYLVPLFFFFVSPAHCYLFFSPRMTSSSLFFSFLL